MAESPLVVAFYGIFDAFSSRIIYRKITQIFLLPKKSKKLFSIQSFACGQM